MVDVVISGTGVYAPNEQVTNGELVEAFNAYVDIYNEKNKTAIDAGLMPAKSHSSTEFIEKASGIKSRHVLDSKGVTNPNIMIQNLDDAIHGDDEKPCIQAEMAIEAAKIALANAGLEGSDIDYVICSAAVLQRAFPAIGIEVQHHLGAKGAAMDMSMACSTATFGIITAIEAIQSGRAERVLMVNPEIFSSMVDYTNRDSHFIFGDAAVAVVIERADLAQSDDQWKVLHTKAFTQYSSNIRTHFGPLSRLHAEDVMQRADMFFMQEGRKVFKELLPLVTAYVEEQLEETNSEISDLSRMWLHQANKNMNLYAAKKLLGRDPDDKEAPLVLDTFGNTAGAGSIIAFHLHRDDLSVGDKGLICSFGAGYSIGSLMVEKIK
ncbi:beta-ketoacyl-ACP synthase III [Temperatibacter marinus]|uniref:Beta-ketoacyl-ACP synthase III n=1 Tax=Temperatibacter marinus TaxID=1456591 RepID=A0AA52H878_9PROT|nr:beta-ketoacyl-ACP synthase III [Temperatibacter marinus]WND01554.1 beta-ketoacyl-ACP synthase III [Temperatibacter marinus]